MKRLPLFIFLSGFISIITFEMGLNHFFSCIFVFVLFLLIKKNEFRVVSIFCVLFFILVFFRMNDISLRTTSLNENPKGMIYSGRIISFPIYKEDMVQFILQVQGDTEEKVQSFIYDNTHSLSYGDVIEFMGKVKVPDGEKNPGGFNYKQYLRGIDIYALLYIDNNSLKISHGDPPHPFKVAISNLRRGLKDYIELYFTSQEKDFLNGLILGEKAMDSQTVSDFGKLGVSHILSISGLHVGYVYMFVSEICKFFKLNKRLQIIIISLFLYVYSFMVGFSMSVIRASLMFVLLLLAEVTNKKYDTLNALCLLAAIFVFKNPYIIYNAGFQLSYSAVLSITLFYPYLNNKYKCNAKYLEYIKSLLLLTFSVQLGTLPIVLYHFSNISLLSLIANLLIVPVAGFIIISFLCIFIISTLLHISLPIFLVPIKLSVSFILGLSDTLMKIPYAFMTLAPMPFYLIGLYYLLVFLSFGYLYYYKETYRKIITGILVLNISIMVFINFCPKPLKVTFLDVGQGDSALIECPKGYNILIDGGGLDDYSVGDEIIAKVLLKKNIQTLNLVICTHSHDDHKLGIIEIVDDIKIEGIVINCLEKEGYKDLITRAKEFNIPVYSNERIEINVQEDLQLEFLYPNNDIPYIDENNSSLITKLTYKEISFLFMGDLEEEGERRLMQSEKNLKSNVIKIGHHGSKTSTSREFLDRVNPEYGIISVGENNLYNHPNVEVLDLLKDKYVHIFRTDEDGAIEIKTFGDITQFKTYLD